MCLTHVRRLLILHGFNIPVIVDLTKCRYNSTIALLYKKIPVALPANAGTARHGIMKNK